MHPRRRPHACDRSHYTRAARPFSARTSARHNSRLAQLVHSFDSTIVHSHRRPHVHDNSHRACAAKPSSAQHPPGATPVLRDLSTTLTAPSYIRAVGRMPTTIHTAPALPYRSAPKHPHGTTPVLRNLSTTLRTASVRRPQISHTYSQSYSSFSRLWLTAPPIV